MGFFSGISKAIGKVAGVAGDIGGISSGLGAVSGFLDGGDDERDFARASAAQANAFTREQLQNRHQWEVADLRAAGLNPILSAMKGAPSIGGSAQASTNASSGSEFSNYVSSASQALQASLNTKKLQAEIDLLKSNAAASKASATQATTQGVKNISEANLSKAELNKLMSQIPAIASSARNQKTEADTWINRYIRPRTRPFAQAIGDFTGAIGNVFRGSSNTIRGN